MSSERVQGVLDAIYYHKNDFLIGRLNSGISVKGTMENPQVGLQYTFTGSRRNDPKYGEHFAFVAYELALPLEKRAIKRYLEENAKWLGEQRTKKLLELYGDNALHICKTDPERVARDVAGITMARAREITDMLKSVEASEQLQLELHHLLDGVVKSKAVRRRVIRTWGRRAPDVIRTNPYDLIQLKGVGFKTADLVAARVGISPNDPVRLQEATLYVLRDEARGGGHVFLPRAHLLQLVSVLTVIPTDVIEDQMSVLESQDDIVCDDLRVYLRKYFDYEQAVARALRVKAMQTFPQPRLDVDGLADDQVTAMRAIGDNGVVIITGAPGTGKTYTLLKVIASFAGSSIALAAPTGKAAKRIEEQTGEYGVTMHRLLEPKINEDGDWYFTRGADDPIKADVIILDECSMIDIVLMAKFLEAVAEGTRLILVGDHYQLPSVGPGNVLRDMIASGEIPSVELTEIKRQEDTGGMIIRNCHRIKDGQDIESQLKGSSWHESDFYFLEADEVPEVRRVITTLLKKIPEAYPEFNPLRDIQVLTPLRQYTALGCNQLNPALQEIFNPNTDGSNFFIRPGDKVIQTRNDYKNEIMNGDIGYVVELDTEGQVIHVNFDVPPRVVELPLFQNDLDLAYALTVHKFQGSEAPVVILPVHEVCGLKVTQRNWLYTAISRARNLCVLVGQRAEIPKMITRRQQLKRFTLLAERLQEEA